MPPQNYVILHDVFSRSGLDKIEAMASLAYENGTVDGESTIRRSKVTWLDANFENRWVYEALGERIISVNANHFHFDLFGFGEQIQLSKYDSQNLGYYDWHHDMSADVDRKVSVTLQLSDPDSYEDGDLELFEVGGPVKTERTRGAMVLFPSYKMHRVTPVTKGVRHSLVCWLSGPPWR